MANIHAVFDRNLFFTLPGHKDETSMGAMVDAVVVVNAPCCTQNMIKCSWNLKVPVCICKGLQFTCMEMCKNHSCSINAWYNDLVFK